MVKVFVFLAAVEDDPVPEQSPKKGQTGHGLQWLLAKLGEKKGESFVVEEHFLAFPLME